jgi:hypothetical protein
VDRFFGDIEGRGGFLDAESAEKPQLDDAAFPFVDRASASNAVSSATRSGGRSSVTCMRCSSGSRAAPPPRFR